MTVAQAVSYLGVPPSDDLEADLIAAGRRAQHLRSFGTEATSIMVRELHHKWGMSLRQISSETGIGRERVRQAVTDQGYVLYRLFSTDELLYVGITNNPERRFRQHAKVQPWWPEVVGAYCTHAANQSELVALERAVVMHEHPRCNVMYRQVPA